MSKTFRNTTNNLLSCSIFTAAIFMGVEALAETKTTVNTPPSIDAFTMVIMGDPQFDWGCAEEFGNNSPATGYCSVQSNLNKSRSEQAADTNNYQIESINDLLGNAGHGKGVIINGDLTDFGSQNNGLERYKSHYSQIAGYRFPGLGNHDYENNINDCGAHSTPNWNYCSADMIEFIAKWQYFEAKNIFSQYNFQYDSAMHQNTWQAGDQENVTGSLAYSWEFGDFHFVQLNNYPTYTTNYVHGYESGISSWDMKITSSLTWLRGDLERAVAANKKIILNWHKYESLDLKAITLFKIYKHNIKAIFVGHKHAKFGHLDDLDLGDGVVVPVIYTGSPLYSRYIRADFNSSGGQCNIITHVISSINSTYNGSGVLDVAASDGSSGTYNINCS